MKDLIFLFYKKGYIVIVNLLLVGTLSMEKNHNPDNICIPYLTAIGDLLGTAFLAFCFHTLYLAGATGLRE